MAQRIALPASLAAIAAAIYFFAMTAGLPFALHVALKGACVTILAIAAAMAARGTDGRLFAGVMALGALGDVLLEFDLMTGAAAFAAGHVFAIWLYLRNRRGAPMPLSQRGAAFALLLCAPFLYLIAGPAANAGIALYSALLAAMAAAAWTSRFSRYRTGIGAILFLVSDAFIFARLGGRMDPDQAALFIWPLYAAGQILIFVGVRQTLDAEER
ncbi:lysoplasmalogenase family protein [Sphingosinicella soli]|uniref:Putative membrane protein YhhN n=1 Tax=Sphingosinicella soli TaxID=333708 RepID=A0A7W7F667_9SPHN|nr:lysoplasmalogenase family protein [Sphingosinicella soli]MBB4631369.1 putative membrane protein YhhN [Sphingosinicella soli]